MSFLGDLQATEPLRFRRRRYVYPSLSGRSILPTRNFWFVLARPQVARYWASREGSCVRGARGSPIRVEPAETSGPSRCSIRLSCFVSPRTSDMPGRTCARLQRAERSAERFVKARPQRFSRTTSNLPVIVALQLRPWGAVAECDETSSCDPLAKEFSRQRFIDEFARLIQPIDRDERS